jgi:hypothetical protein
LQQFLDPAREANRAACGALEHRRDELLIGLPLLQSTCEMRQPGGIGGTVQEHLVIAVDQVLLELQARNHLHNDLRAGNPAHELPAEGVLAGWVDGPAQAVLHQDGLETCIRPAAVDLEVFR